MHRVELDSERLRLRQIQAADWELFLELHTNPSIIRYVCDPLTEADIHDRFESRLPVWLSDSDHWMCLVVTDCSSGQPTGVTGLRRLSPEEAEVGYLFLPTHQGKGYAGESLNVLIAYARDVMKLSRLKAVVTDGNLPSCRVLEKCGFVLEQRVEQAFQLNQQVFDDLVYINRL
ncbi:GNAT family N-acetyltransferase [Pseudomonas putida]|uniref:GNAT family N-acetyltransferase n=1 Tax=Pseudomonas putida TaxID=303 RepID=UPI0035715291